MDLKDHSVPILSHRRGCQPLDQAAQATAQCGAISKLLRVHTRSHHLSLTFVSLIKTLRSSGLRMEPLGGPHPPQTQSHWPQPSGRAHPTNYPLNTLPFKSVSLQFREKDAVWDHAEGSAQGRVRTKQCSITGEPRGLYLLATMPCLCQQGNSRWPCSCSPCMKTGRRKHQHATLSLQTQTRNQEPSLPDEKPRDKRLDN